MITYGSVILFCWAAFIIVWAFSAFNVKKDIRGRGLAILWMRLWFLRIVAAALVIFAAYSVGHGTAHFSGRAFFARGQVFVPPFFLGWIAALLAVLGVALAIWARVSLGRNWSSAPAVKEGHELVTDGPYAHVRHPIYSGVGLMLVGTALAGSLYGIIMLVVAIAVFGRRIGKEEAIMRGLFPDQYPEYEKRTKRIVPFVW